MLELYFFEHVLLHLLVKWALSKILYHIILKEAKFRYRFAWEECNHEGRKKYTYNHHDLFAVYVWGSLYNLSVCDVSRNWVNILVTLPFKGNLMRAAGMFCTLRMYDELLFIYFFLIFKVYQCVQPDSAVVLCQDDWHLDVGQSAGSLFWCHHSGWDVFSVSQLLESSFQA